jgi:HlyD family secretion protein
LAFANQQLENSRQQLQYAREQLENSRQQLQYAREQLNNSREQLKYSQEQLELARGQLVKSEQVLQSNQEILDNISPLVEEGAIAQLQQKRQQQEVLRGESELLGQRDRIESRSAEINTRKGEINSRLAEVNSREGDVTARMAEVNNREGDITARMAEIKRIEGDINARQSEVSSRMADINAREGEVQATQAEIRRSELEQERIAVSIERTREQLQNTKDSWARELYNRVATNKTAIAGIDSQFSKLQLDNKKRLTEINAQVEKLKQTRDDQVLKAPVSGLVFDLTPGSKEEASLDIAKDPICQYVINDILEPGEIKPKKCEEAYYEAQQTEPLLTILDDEEGLEAVVYIQNKDIALVLNALREKREKLEPLDGRELASGETIDCKPGKSCICPELKENREKLGLTDRQCVPVEVQVQALPANEFGTVAGEVISISKDAIPPDPQQERPFFSFETTIRLSRQTVILDRESDLEIALQNGMAVNSNIKVGKRSVLELFFSRFTSKFKSLTNVN